MGIRLNYARTYKVEYGQTGMFNCRAWEFHNLLDALGIGYSGESFDEDFECPVDEWNRGVERLRQFIGGTAGNGGKIREAIAGLEPETPQAILSCMEAVATKADVHDGFIRLSFF